MKNGKQISHKHKVRGLLLRVTGAWAESWKKSQWETNQGGHHACLLSDHKSEYMGGELATKNSDTKSLPFSKHPVFPGTS